MARYTRKFYKIYQDRSLSSAEVVVPHVLSLFQVRSVVDVGCGVGGWLRVFESNGIHDYLGYDGAHVPSDMLKIPKDRFRAADLRSLITVDRQFDLACSLEVAEHLPASCAREFVDMLVKAAPVVLFSAAIPHQGGDGHVNEQWQSYWWDLFSAHGRVAIDCVRPTIYNDPRVEWWYRQNALVYCDRAHVPSGYEPITNPMYINQVHPEMLEALTSALSARAAIRAIVRDVGALAKAVSGAR